jgi:O-antigen ligase
MIPAAVEAWTPWAGSLRPPRWRRSLRAGLVATAVVAGAGAAGGLIASNLWFVVVGALLAIPAVLILHRRPMVAVGLWILVGPIVAVSNDVGLRKLYWIFHRGLPLLAVVLILASGWAGLRERPRVRLGWIEALMAAYVAVTVVSILYTAVSPLETLVTFYDRVLAPMFLYLIVRLTDPDERELELLFVPMLFLLVTQSVIGTVSWIAPSILPAEWLINVGRTSGSLRDPDLFAVSLIFSGMYLLHFGLRSARGVWARTGLLVLMILALFMAFLSYERAAWLAGLLVTAALLFIFRRIAVRFVPAAALALVILLASGALSGPLAYANGRLHSPEADESALARLPPALAAVRMFKIKPVTGWGYDQFDRFSTPFQGRIGELVFPEKIHASHNAFLSLIAEQGMPGFILFLGPVFGLLLATPMAARKLRFDPNERTRLLAVCWLGVLTFVVVNNFENMKVTFGLGLWWLILGLIATTIERARRLPDAAVPRSVTPGGTS